MSEQMIGIEPLQEIVETAIFSSCLSGSIPISLILIGPSGAGKSKLILQYRETNGCHITNDVTSIGLQEMLSKDHKQEIKFMVIPDFNVVLSHRASTLQLTVANLLSVMSEGTIRIDDGRQEKETKHNPVGMLTAITRDLYSHVARKWAILGFNRRFLPIYYEYTLGTRLKIQESIAQGKTTLLQLVKKPLPLPKEIKPIEIGLFAPKIQTISDELSTNMGWIPAAGAHSTKKEQEETKVPQRKTAFIGKQLEFSPHLALRAMASAHAARDKRRQVNIDDMAFLMKLLEFTRYDRPGML